MYLFGKKKLNCGCFEYSSCFLNFQSIISLLLNFSKKYCKDYAPSEEVKSAATARRKIELVLPPLPSLRQNFFLYIIMHMQCTSPRILLSHCVRGFVSREERYLQHSLFVFYNQTEFIMVKTGCTATKRMPCVVGQ